MYLTGSGIGSLAVGTRTPGSIKHVHVSNLSFEIRQNIFQTQRFSVMSMSTFCNGPFFDAELSWNTTNPNLTKCFRDTVLIGVPAAVLWIFGPIWALLNHGERRNHPGNHDHGRNTRLSKLKVTFLPEYVFFRFFLLCLNHFYPTCRNWSSAS